MKITTKSFHFILLHNESILTLSPFCSYVALFNYKPQKNDELELRKSEVYLVTEKCQDGWYKGNSLKTGASGVFPGNYVTISK